MSTLPALTITHIPESKNASVPEWTTAVLTSSQLEMGGQISFAISAPIEANSFLYPTRNHISAQIAWRIVEADAGFDMSLFSDIDGTFNINRAADNSTLTGPNNNTGSGNLNIAAKKVYSAVDETKTFKIAIYKPGVTLLQAKAIANPPTPWAILGPFTLKKRKIDISITTDKETYEEGDQVNVTVTTAGVFPKNIVPLKIVGIDATSLQNDLNLTSEFQSAVIENGTFKFSMWFKPDNLYDNAEGFKIQAFEPSLTAYTPGSSSPIYETTVKTLNDKVRTIEIKRQKEISRPEIVRSAATNWKEVVVPGVYSDITYANEGTDAYFNIYLTNIISKTDLVFRLVSVGGTVLSGTSADISMLSTWTIDANGVGIIKLYKDDTIVKTYPTTITGVAVKLTSDILGETGEGLKLQVFPIGTNPADVNSVTPWAESEVLELRDVATSATVIGGINSTTPTAISSVNEGQTLYFNVTTTNIADNTVLAYRLVGSGITASDINTKTSIMTGTFTIKSNSARLEVPFIDDTLAESGENIKLELFGRGVALANIASATPWAESNTVNVLDISRSATIVASTTVNGTAASSIDEGKSIVFNIATTGIADKTLLAYKITGNNLTEKDLSSTGLTGTVTITSNKAVLSIPVKDDGIVETGDTIKLQLFGRGVALANIASATPWAESNTVNILDISRSAVITTKILQSSSSTTVIPGTIATEGNTVEFTITTTNIYENTEIAYRISGDGITSSDTVTALTGTIKVAKTGVTYLRVNLSDDAIVESGDTIKLQLFAVGVKAVDIPKNTPWVESSAISVVDINRTATISQKSGASIAAAATSTTVREGQYAVFSIATTNVANNTELAYKIVGTGLTDADVIATGTKLSGTVKVVNNSATVSRTISTDKIKETGETIKLQLFRPGVKLIDIGKNSPWIESTEMSIIDTTK